MKPNNNTEAIQNLKLAKDKATDPGLKQAISDKLKALSTNQTVKK